MKYLKLAGLAAIATLALAAFAGATTASAAVLCKTAPNKSGVCEGGKYTALTTFQANSVQWSVLTILNSAVVSTVSCRYSVLTVQNPFESGLLGVFMNVTDLAFYECATNSGTACTVSTTSGYTGNLAPTTDTGNGTLTLEGSGSFRETKVSCGGFFECKYVPKAKGISLTLTGGNPAKLSATAAEVQLVGGFGFGCGDGAKWDASLVLNGANTALWVATS